MNAFLVVGYYVLAVVYIWQTVNYRRNVRRWQSELGQMKALAQKAIDRHEQEQQR